MRAVLQRVTQAQVTVEGRVIGAIDRGYLVLLGIGADDTDADLDYIVTKVPRLRLFEDPDGKMNLTLQEVDGALLVVSQFTLYGDTRKGRRPSFVGAMEPGTARAMVDRAVSLWQAAGLRVQTGQFGAMMQVALTNDGPVTLLLDSARSA